MTKSIILDKSIQRKNNLSREAFTRQFKILILQKKLTQKDIAFKLGISEQLMSHIISGIRTGKKYRKQICKILEVKESVFGDLRISIHPQSVKGGD